MFSAPVGLVLFIFVCTLRSLVCGRYCFCFELHAYCESLVLLLVVCAFCFASVFPVTLLSLEKSYDVCLCGEIMCCVTLIRLSLYARARAL